MVKRYFDTEKKRKLQSKHYDSLYDLNSETNYAYDKEIITFNKQALSEGYHFKLNDTKQKFEVKKMDNPSDSPYYKGGKN